VTRSSSNDHLGGGFGRRLINDFIEQAVMVNKAKGTRSSDLDRAKTHATYSSAR